jgi:hypothetical protein
MAVYQTGGGGGFFSSLMKGLGSVASFVPGLQPFAPFIGAAGALASGNVGGAIGSAVAPMLGNAMQGATQPPSDDSCLGSWQRAYVGNLPDYNSDPVTGDMGFQSFQPAGEVMRNAMPRAAQANDEDLYKRWGGRWH